jgi:hypothetical protein
MGMPSPSAEGLGRSQNIISKARDQMFNEKLAQRQQDMGDPVAVAAHGTGPGFDPNSALILQGLQDAGVTKVKAGPPSPIFGYDRNRR